MKHSQIVKVIVFSGVVYKALCCGCVGKTTCVALCVASAFFLS
jgi:hypothetical protein